jgi:hypothetical protein
MGVLPLEIFQKLRVLADGRLHPAIGVADHGAEVGVDDFAPGCGRSGLSRDEGCCGQAEKQYRG